ncbi:NAD-dependent histone deacetylase sir2 [Malassezia japonica]|uniref:NAD-dependent histone deacetylase sir2 n=1 Tax=Malassezia japonica TaxID=223818 RepID=A0AAF0EZ10_9BASI|nr:NAD-dependent histone deacetylase sir2 [Malassezia japonica]WFD39681.1 NAD-dependent histone deacetylase sir2 [Malassezia japonica]
MTLNEVGPSAEALAELATLDDDLNSEDLDRLEEEAEQEMMEELEREGVQGAAELAEEGASSSSEPEYGPLSREEVSDVIHDLREHGILVCLQRHVVSQPEKIVPLLLSLGVMLPRNVLEEAESNPYAVLPLLKMVLTRILRQRQKLDEFNTLEDVLRLLRTSKKIVVLCGAGISVSCGIPDFRSKDGIYAILAQEEKYELDDPSDMFDKEVFLRDPSLFYSFAHSIYPANFQPSASHYFVKQLEERGKLLRMYSQNIDTLEQKAGISRVLQCHGSFATATCTDPSCGYKVDGSVIRDDLLAKRIPACPRCTARREDADARRRAKRPKTSAMWGGDESEDESDLAYGIMKPDITFFGEKLPDEFDRCVFADREEVDLILVMGTSLKVAPVADLLTHLPSNVPVVLLNRTPITHMAMDVMLLGDSDGIVQYLGKELGWEGSHSDAQPERVGESHVYKFPGADGGWYVDQLEGRDEDESDVEHASGEVVKDTPVISPIPLIVSADTP